MISTLHQKLIFEYYLVNKTPEQKPQVLLEAPENISKGIVEALDQNKEIKDYRNNVENTIAEAYVAFVDISHFSSKISGCSVDEVKEYLEGYYHLVVPKIHKYHGQIDKIMGDGIVVVFSDVFGFEYPNGAGNACLSFCKECIESLEETCYEVKAAIASGSMYFCKTGVEEIYEEISCIGHPMTVVFRLENEASANEIWMLASDSLTQNMETKDGWFSHLEEVYLKGVEESEAIVYQYNSLI